VIYVPFLRSIFDATSLTLVHWAYLIPLIMTPSVIAEITKMYLRRFHEKEQVLYAAR
jgi:hypothetical protein